MRLHSAIPKRVSEGGCGNLLNRVSEANRGTARVWDIRGALLRTGAEMDGPFEERRRRRTQERNGIYANEEREEERAK